MARNLIQLVFLAYAALLIYASHKGIRLIMTRKIGANNYARKTSGLYAAATLLPLKGDLAPGLFYWNLCTVAGGAACAVLQLVFGWFGFFRWPASVLNSLVLLASAVQGFLLALISHSIRFGQMFFWYRADAGKDTRRPFASSVLDVVLYGVIPFCMILCNFVAF